MSTPAAVTQPRPRVGYRVFIGLVLAASAWLLAVGLRAHLAELEAERREALDAVRSELARSMTLAQSYVELLKGTAESELAGRPTPAPPSPFLMGLRQGLDDNFHLDTLPPGVAPDEVGNLTGHGKLDLRDADFARELEMAFTLRAISRQIRKDLPYVPWSYYVSQRHFEHVYPWRTSAEFSFKEADLTQEYFIRGTPEANPDRQPYVTDVYEDDFGQGLMISMGRPVYAGDRFMGIVALDFTLKHLDGVLAKFPKSLGELYLVDKEKRVIGYSRRSTPEAKVELPAGIARALILGNPNTGEAPVATPVDRETILVTGLPLREFTLINSVGNQTLYLATVNRASLEITGFLSILALLGFIDWRRRHALRVLAQAAELREANAQLAVAKREAEDATRAKSSFLAMMSHEIRTPMNGVLTMAEMIDHSDLTDDQRGMTAVIRSSSAALLTVINDILDFSKIESGRMDIESVSCSVVDIVENVGELVSQRAEDSGIELSIVIEPTAPDRVRGDPTRIRQVLLNLVSNAIKFTEVGGVTVRVRAAEPGVAHFEVADTGIGLTPEQHGRLFKAFEQADSTTARRFGGTGLGLSISRQLCELMGGRIGAHSEFGKGSTFWFELPLAPLVDETAGPVSIADACIVAVDFHGGPAAGLDAILAAAGVQNCVHMSSSGASFSEILATDGLIFLSAQSGDPRIVAVGAEIKARAPHRPVVLVASRGLRSTLNEGDLSGFFAAVTFPLRRASVRQVIAAALGRGDLVDRTVGGRQVFDPPAIEVAQAAGVVVLVAEDNSTNRIVIQRLLSNLGYAMELAKDGASALAAYSPGVHGLLLTDIHMPGMDGFSLAAEIRRRETGGETRLPIVALTADALPRTEQRCKESGMDGYLAKPIDSKLLAATLEKWLPAALALRRPQQAQRTRRRAADVKIDPKIFKVGQLEDSFGAFNDAARAFLANFVGAAPAMAAEVTTAMAASDWAEARKCAHSLKGAALSIGAVRLGTTASEIEVYLEQDDTETAALFAAGLATSVSELAGAVAPLIAKT